MGVSGRQPGGVGGVLDGGLDSILPCLGSVRACVTDARLVDLVYILLILLIILILTITREPRLPQL